jgi:pSer/pThr/pTyr-binding forkhead associated (FHA) protein
MPFQAITLSFFEKGKTISFVHDLNSTNGTRVNGQRIVETRLTHGDTVWFGHLQCQYFSNAKNAPQPLPALKKTVDLTNAAKAPRTTTMRPSTFVNSSPFAKQAPNKSKKMLQFAIIGFGVLGVVILAICLVMLLKS